MKLSVIIPAYNDASYLRTCLEALAKQTRLADEVIIVNNNSTDDTVDVAKEFNATVVAESIQGILPATYKGFCESSGDIIVRCDTDTIPPTDWLEKFEQTFADNPNAVAVTGPGIFYDTNVLSAKLASLWYMHAYFFSVGLALANTPLFGSNFAIRRSYWRQIKDHIHVDRVDVHDDIEISIHIPPTAKVIYDANLKVGISARALRPRGLPRRYLLGAQSLSAHWPKESPRQRWVRKLTRR